MMEGDYGEKKESAVRGLIVGGRFYALLLFHLL